MIDRSNWIILGQRVLLRGHNRGNASPTDVVILEFAKEDNDFLWIKVQWVIGGNITWITEFEYDCLAILPKIINYNTLLEQQVRDAINDRFSQHEISSL